MTVQLVLLCAVALRNEPKRVVPEGFRVIEGDRRKQLRLNREIVFEAMNPESLAKHANKAVQKIGAGRVKRKAQGENVFA